MIDTKELLSQTNIIDVVSKHVSLRRNGSEHYGLCPFHKDKSESLQVNEKKQIFKCFACGEGGDSIEFLRKLGYDFHEACKEIGGDSINSEINPIQNTVQKSRQKPEEWKYISVPPQNDISINHYKMGKPNKIWIYHDSKGVKICYISRFDLADGSKQVLPMVYASKGNKTEWRWMGIPENRPLYNLHLIVKYPEASIILVEGEKTADAVQKHFSPEKTIATTWIGGANGIKKADFSKINDKGVIFWADNDVPGLNAMNNISDLINSTVKKFVVIPKNMPVKWDAADKDWETGEIEKFITGNLTINKYPILIEPKKVTKPLKSIKNPPLPPNPKTEIYRLAQNDHFKILGYDKDESSKLVYYFFSFDAKSVIKLSPSAMNKSNLMMIAPLNWWEDMYGAKRTKIDIDAAQQFLISSSHKIGPFRDKLIRGRGVWIDNDKFIIHTGENLIIDSKKHSLSEYPSKYVYEIGENLGFGVGKQLNNVQCSEMLDLMKWLSWERSISAYLLTGWCVIAPFCGVLEWRPHLWLTGPAGSGKSWVMEKVLKKILGETPIVVQGKTTEAGVRGLLKSDARPVLFDESDVDDGNDKDRIQSILALARSSSYSNGGVIGKGTQTGSARSYTIRSCFAFSSIGIQLNQQSDRSRFTVLSLQSFEGKKTKQDFANFELSLDKLLTEEYIEMLQARTLSILNIILENSKTFSDAASHVIGNRRVGDQIGGMLAGAYSLNSRTLISYEDAVKWVKDKDWNDEKSLSNSKDELQLFSVLMGHTIKIEGEYRTFDRTIGELILIESNYLQEPTITPVAAKGRLRRVGIMIVDNHIVFSNTSPAIKKIISGTAWGSNHANVLFRIENAKKFAPRTFYPGLNGRGVGIPLSRISDEYTFKQPDESGPAADSNTDDLFKDTKNAAEEFIFKGQ